jgi:AP-3 complex subunit mu
MVSIHREHDDRQNQVRVFTREARTCTRSVSEQLPTGQLSNIPWRRAGVKYTNNEAYFDVTEEIDVIIDKSGQALCAEIQGYVRWAHCRASNSSTD